MSGPWYGPCRQTVTVYSRHGEGAVRRWRRTVLEGCAYLEGGRGAAAEQGVAEGKERFLLVLPPRCGGRRYVGAARYREMKRPRGVYSLAPGDKVVAGVGPQVTGEQEWLALVPGRVDGVYLIGTVKEIRGPDGTLWHVEGSG